MDTLLVVQGRSYEVVMQDQTAATATLSVIADGRYQWSFNVAAWHPMSYGVSGGLFYLWSARQFIVFSVSLDHEPTRTEFDEDLLLAYKVEAGWIFVCETSVRYSSDSAELVRLELDEVIESARWEGGKLVVHDAAFKGAGRV